MTSTPVTSLGQTSEREALIPREAWIWILLLGLLLVLFHRVFLYRTYLFATTDNNWSHALIVPLIGAYYIYQKRDRLLATPARVCWWGLPILFFGLFNYAFGILPVSNNMFQGYSMILGLFGLALFLLGPGMMKVLWFPILFLVFAVKVSDRIWEQVAFQLQNIAAVGATFVLQFFTVFLDFEANYRGATIDLSFVREGQWITEPLNVAEACSGLRMLMAFLALGTAMAFLWKQRWWQRFVMIAMAVPIALLVNIGRVTALGVLYLFDAEYAQGGFHTFIGMLMLIPAALLFLLLGWVLDQVVIEEKPQAKANSATPGSREADVDSASGENAGLPEKWRLGWCAGAGMGLAALTGLAYLLLLGALRPDLLWEGLSSSVAWAGLAVVLGGIIVGFVFLPRLVPAVWRGTGKARHCAASIAAGALLVSVLGQSAVLAATEAVMFKEPVPLRHRLLLLPDQLGPWQLLREDPPLSREMIEELGTDNYLSRWYRDTGWPEDEPGGVMRLHVTYYTGTVDTVPHVPDRCFVAGGMENLGRGMTSLHLDGPAYEPDPETEGYIHPATREPMVRVPSLEIDATRFTFAEPSSPDNVENVVYFFIANGQFMATPEEVRLYGFDPRDQYSYYCKIEVQIHRTEDPEVARERASDFLSHALPELLACLPDWVDVREGRWPEEGEGRRAERASGPQGVADAD